jgi:toxin ParE1/3/4
MASERLEAEFLRKIDMLRTFPEMGRPGRVAGKRELVMHPNYIAIYAVRPDTIDMLRILHARQLYP